MSLVERIKSEATKLNMTFASIERDVRLGNGAIRKWDSNPPSVDRLSKVANLLNLSIDELYNPTSSNSLDTPKKESNLNLSTSELELLVTYNKLDPRGQHRLHTIIYEELDRMEAAKNKSINQKAIG